MPTCVIYFDLENDSMTTEEYYNYCVQSLYIDNLYHIVFKVNNLEYPALFEAESKSTTFYDITKSIDLDNNYYLQLALNGAVNIKTTGVEFPYIKMREMSALNTIFYIETFFYDVVVGEISCNKTTKPSIWNTLLTGLTNVTISHNTLFHNNFETSKRSTIHNNIVINNATYFILSLELPNCSLVGETFLIV